MNIGIDIDDTISDTFESAIVYAKEYIKNEYENIDRVYSWENIYSKSKGLLV